MLKGVNTIKLNQASMIDALQKYFEPAFANEVIVTSVKQTSASNNYSHEDSFEVTLTERIKEGE